MKRIRLLMTGLLLLVTCAAFAQKVTVTGTVTEATDGSAVPYVSVAEKGTMNGVVTDESGNFSISVKSSGVIVISAVGYKTVEMPVDGKTKIDVALEQDTEMLDETIVVAFGTATKSSFTGSASVMSEEQLSKFQVTSATDALAGQVAGVQLTSSNGAPGASSTIRIRGFSSISAGQGPLIVVDGAPYSGDLNNINPSDIASMTVLKDAASTSLYGARGANGVIIVTTKKAQAGKAEITFETKIGVNTRALRDYDVITDPGEYYEMHYAALNNYYQNVHGYSAAQANAKANSVLCGTSGSGGLGYQSYAVPEGQNLIGLNGRLNPNATLGNKVTYNGEEYLILPDKWADTGYKTGVRQEYNLSLASSTAKSNYFASLSYLDNQGITDGSGMKRFTARMKADTQIKKWLKMGGNFSYSKYNYDSLTDNGTSNSTGNVWAFTSQLAPIYPLFIRNGDGSIKRDSNGFEMMDYGVNKGAGTNAGLARSYFGDANALMDNRLNTHNAEGNQFIASGFFDINFTKHLKLNVNGTVTVDETRSTNVYNPYYGQFKSTGGTVDKSHGRLFEIDLQQLLTYTNTWGKHSLDVMLGHEWYDSKTYKLGASKSQMFSQGNKELSGAAVDGQSSYSSIAEYNNEGFFGRILYDFDERIYLSGMLRGDASSRFAPENRWGMFWSLGASWLINKEKWFHSNAVDMLKIKGSIGSQGNDQIGSYRYTDTYSISNSSGKVATSFYQKGNRNITWETNTNLNVGVEFGFWKRFTGSVEYFNRMTTDMLFSFPVSPSLGYTSYYDNVGDMRNQGVEFDFNVNIFREKNFTWDINGNVTWLKNKITMLDSQKKTTKAYDADGNMYEGYQDGNFFVGEGTSQYSWYLREYAGVNENGESLWYKDVKDAQGNRTGERTTTTSYSDADYYLSGSTTIAPVYGGFGTRLGFYGFDFSVAFTYQLGGKQYDGTYATFMGSPDGSNIGYNYHKDLYNSWSASNTSSNIPRFQYGDTYSAGMSSRFLTDASYLNLQSASLGYTFPTKWMSKIKVTSLRLFVTGDNLWYWSKRQGFDPRQSNDSETNGTYYSPMRTISGGLSIKF